MADWSGKAVVLEEHFLTPALCEVNGNNPDAEVARRLLDVGPERLKAMDDARIDVQVLSHTSPGTQQLAPDLAVRLARDANDALARTVAAHPDRFAGFAILPIPDPQACLVELERAVTKLGFKGAMVHGLTHGAFLDEKRFWPIFGLAAELDVPIYVHPAHPHPAVIEAYYRDYPGMAHAAWGFGVETAMQAIRLVLSGVFDAHPNLKIILGHLGEGLPFSLWRADRNLSGKLTKRSFREYFCEHFYITTSGNFSFPALLCSIMELGADRILFSIDYPFEATVDGREFIDAVPLCSEDKEKILSRNAVRLLKL